MLAWPCTLLGIAPKSHPESPYHQPQIISAATGRLDKQPYSLDQACLAVL